MRTNRFILIIFALLSGCSSNLGINQSGAAFVVQNFEQGKMRKEANGWVVYEPGQEMNVSVNGKCVFNKQVIPCMWHGFVLEYDSKGQDVALNCKSYSSSPANIGNPKGVEAFDTNIFEYTIPLKGNRSRFVNPQYVGLRSIGGSVRRGSVRHSTECSVSGVKVIEFTQIFHYSSLGIQI
jgi:uncharacterized protein YceK